MNGIIAWFYTILGIAAIYAQIRMFWVFKLRWDNNKSCKIKVPLVNMYDILHLMIEFFSLPVLLMKWISKT